MPSSLWLKSSSRARCVAPALTALALLAWCPTAALAQAATPGAASAATQFPIRGFELTGDIPLDSAQTTLILAPFIGTQGSIDTLQKATAALEAALKDQGYALHRVYLPPQEMGDRVKLNVVKFVIGKVTVEGNTAYTEENIRASLPELRAGEAPNFRALAVQTAIANENPGKQVQVSLKESDQPDKIDARVLVKESRPWSLSTGLANTGSTATGNDRFSVVAAHSNVWGLDHQFSAAYTTSLERGNDVMQVGLNYRVPLYRLGGVLGVSYTNSDVVGNFGTFSSSGAGQTFGLSYNHYLPPDGGRRTYWSVGLESKQFNASKVDGVAVQGALDRGSMPLTLGYNVRVEADASAFNYNAEVSVNVPGSTGNNLEAYQSDDARIRTVNWTALRMGANYMGSFASGWLWNVRGQLQYSPHALIAGEQFGIGGSSSVRGTGERVLSGDSGVAATLEFSTPEWWPGLRFHTFVDAGRLSSNDTDLTSSGKLSSDQLASAGLGLRYTIGSVGLSAEWGRIVTGGTPPAGTGAAPPAVGDEKLHVNLTARF